ncbi:hypothetical protein PACTADRAFT_24933, partial [Pachysolen tannophilus NRRL Y-2460]
QRTFSSSIKYFNSAKKDLETILKSELEFEKNDAFSLEKYHQDWLASSGFQIINVEDKVLAELVKKNGNEIIHVYFDVVQITNSPFENEMDEQDDEQLIDENNEDGELRNLVNDTIANVNVVIENTTDNSAIGIDLLLSVSNNKFAINGLSHFEDATLALSETAEADSKRQLKYNGPPFSNLAEELQDSLTGYLTSRGIDEQLGDFIVAYSTVKENNEYISWLTNLKKFF